MADTVNSSLNGLEMHDVLLHTKTMETYGAQEKLMFPISRWEGIAGAPHVVTPETFGKKYPAEWCVMVTEELELDTEEFQAVFGDLVTA